MSPNTDAVANPAYKAVCRGDTTHVEVLHIKFDKNVVSYEELVKYLFTFHDATTKDKQGNDRGTQYASTVFYHSEEQRLIAEKVINQVQDLVEEKKIPKYTGFKVMTNLSKATEFYPAHKEHQEYLLNNPKGYCNHRPRFDWAEVNDEYIKED